MIDRDRNVTVGITAAEAAAIGEISAVTGASPHGVARVAMRLGVASLSRDQVQRAIAAGEIRAVRRRSWPHAGVHPMCVREYTVDDTSSSMRTPFSEEVPAQRPAPLEAPPEPVEPPKSPRRSLSSDEILAGLSPDDP